MKIGFLAHGKSVWMHHWASLLTKLRYDIVYFSFDPPSQTFPFQYQIIPSFFLRGFLKFIFTAKFLQTSAKTHKIDVFHAFYSTNYGLIGSLQHQVPLIVTVAGSDLLLEPHRSIFFKWVNRYVTKRARFVNAVSEELRDVLISEYAINPAKIRVFAEGVDLNALHFDVRKQKSRNMTIISTRNFYDVYDPGTIFDAIPIVLKSFPDTHFLFLGDGPLLTKYQRFISSRHLLEQVSFGGWVPRRQLFEKLAHSHIYVSASRSDGTSTSLLEAMASGCLPIVSDIPANRQWISNQQNGLLFRVGDSNSLAQSICQAIEDPSWRQHAVRLNRHLVQTRASETEVAVKLEEMYSLAIS